MGIVIELDPGANLYVRIFFAGAFDNIKIDAVMKAIVIGQGNIGQAVRARTVDPGLQKLQGIARRAMRLRVGVIIGEESNVDC